MDRKDIILEGIDIENGKGLEIGPSYNPCVEKRKGYDVEIVDHLDKNGLIERYKNEVPGFDANLIEEVDYIWNGEKYSDLTGKKNYYDYIIASHVIEHVTDFIGFLQDCSTMLKEKGKLSLVIPDKRYCFDHFRTLTDVGKVIDDFVEKRKVHSAGAVAEYCLNVVKKNDQLTWRAFDLLPNYKFIHTLDYAKCSMAAVRDSAAYIDIHEYRFIPESFKLLIEDLHLLRFIDLSIFKMHDTINHEFFVTLEKNANTKSSENDFCRMDLLKRIYRYNEEGFSWQIDAAEKEVRKVVGKNYYIDKFEKIDEILNINGWCFVDGMESSQCEIWVKFKQNNKMYSTMKYDREDVGTLFKNTAYNESGFACLIDCSKSKGISKHDMESVEIVVRYQGQFYC